uniref:peroxiredoxin n=1 Tax=Acidiphilium sp. TaxID=527 RepID=UPI0025833E63
MSVAEGDQAPDFTLPATGGRTVSRAGYKGRPFILYFYPKADTPGCTKEACAFQDGLGKLGKLPLEIIGVSRDPLRAIDKFATKYGLAFPLASDESGAPST